MIPVSRVPDCPTFLKEQVKAIFGRVGQQTVSHEGKSAGQSTCPTTPSLKGVGQVIPNLSPPPPLGSADRGTHLRIVATDQSPDGEPGDEELWLEHIARQVEADARPLVAALWLWLLRRALELDENEEPA